jgi:hypothetical protein
VPFDLLGAFHFWLVSGQIGSESQPQIAGGIFEQNDIDVLIILLPAKNCLPLQRARRRLFGR